jgi:hypothetical protein
MVRLAASDLYFDNRGGPLVSNVERLLSSAANFC